MSARDQKKVPQTNLLPGNPACIHSVMGTAFPLYHRNSVWTGKASLPPPGQAIRVILLILLQQWKGLTRQGPLSKHPVSSTEARGLHVNVECTRHTIRKWLFALQESGLFAVSP